MGKIPIISKEMAITETMCDGKAVLIWASERLNREPIALIGHDGF